METINDRDMQLALENMYKCRLLPMIVLFAGRTTSQRRDNITFTRYRSIKGSLKVSLGKGISRLGAKIMEQNELRLLPDMT